MSSIGSSPASCFVQTFRMALSALATLKLVLLLASGIAQHISSTPPNPPPSPQKTLKRNFFEKYIYIIISIVTVSDPSSAANSLNELCD